MEGDVVWHVMTESVGGKNTITLVHCISTGIERFESYELGDIVRTCEDCLITNVPAGSEGKIVHLIDPVRYRRFVFVKFGEGLSGKNGSFGTSQLVNLTRELTFGKAVTVA